MLNSEWLDFGGIRCFRALYCLPDKTWAVAQVLQRKGISTFEVGMIAAGSAVQLKPYTISTVEAVVWLDIWKSNTYDWEIVL